MADIGSENRSFAGDYCSLKEKHSDDSQQRNIVGISNKGMISDEEKLEISTEEGGDADKTDEATQETNKNEEEHLATATENSSNECDTKTATTKL